MSEFLVPYAGHEKPVLPASVTPLRSLLHEVSKKHRVRVEAVIGPCRDKSLVHARREYVWRARTELQASFPRMARIINRDHTSCVYLYYQVESGASMERFELKPKAAAFGRAFEASDMHAAGVPIDEIAERLGIKKSSVLSYISKVRLHGYR